MKFIKMESNSSDFIIINNFEMDSKKYLNNIKKICDRNTGIGSNGIVFIEPSSNALVKLDIYNSDGSKPNFNINAIFCACEYLKNIIKLKKYDIEVNNNIISIVKEGKMTTVNDLSFDLNPKKIPVITEKNLYFDELLMIDNKFYDVSCITVGNPHVIVQTDNIYSTDVEEIGRKIQDQYIFPEKINVVFNKFMNDKIYIRIYEIGNEETKSCGTAACAALVHLYYNSKIIADKEYEVFQDGGESLVTINDKEKIKIKGKANYLFKGKI